MKTNEEKIEDVICKSEGDIENANYHSMTELPRELWENLSIYIAPELRLEAAKKMRKVINSLL